MSRHRVKSLDYDDDDFEDEYDEVDPEEQEQLEAYTNEVMSALQTGQPPVTASRQEAQEALWHYYNDVDKSVNYIRSKKLKDIKKRETTASTKSTTGAVYPVDTFIPRCSSHFSAADFFRDAPWLNIPHDRKADIIVEPLYPRLGLLGGAAEGKMSKLAALAAARKKKDSEKLNTIQQSINTEECEKKPTQRSLSERLSSRVSEKTGGGLSALNKGSRLGGRLSKPGTPSVAQERGKVPVAEQPLNEEKLVSEINKRELEENVNIRAPPSTFAVAIVGDENYLSTPEPRHLPGSSFDVMQVYGQSLTEAFDFAGPSPDDVVINAQGASKGLKSTQAASSKGPRDKKNQGDLSGNLKALSVEEPVRVKSKNLDVLAEYEKSRQKKAANFVVIGHVDAGKSTLMGRLLADLNAIDKRTMEKYRREAEKIGKGSFAFAWVLDQGSEERARGVTIDIATNQFETDNTRFTIVDAPGHRDFIPNMIAGASQADFAVLVIDAGTGNFESGLKGQTKEHALLVRSMGVQKVVVAVNKMDTVSWSKDRFDEIEQQVSSFLTTAGFQAKNLSFIPCSGYHGDNITRRSENPNAAWYTGSLLIEELETSEPFSHALDRPLRMTIGDVFRGGVQNPLSISGRIDAGSLQVGDSLLVMPSGESALIKGLERDGEPGDWAVAGQNVILHLANIDPIHLRSGDIVCSPVSPIQNVQSFTTKVLAFDHLMPMQIDVHRGRLHVSGRISRLVATLDKGSGVAIKKKPKIVSPGTIARIVVEIDQPAPLEAPSRVVLRAAGETVAAGLLE
ncbi:putative translation elongation factor EF-1 subunit [Talaromyces proteolyticus]|uniref:Elongation factor 1 alpha-like protein n=1 Tax=Talaromyces proteolyticus TaxID=1131652 RepID=A0AAD4Q5U1_9EURO|nr:putative translation elongation factor EF-1 subunit [Talaromyces proteolyticus]KAH8704966.1 putative translation elongation factor EF-1 subunit [Talaromyces proteolyticus]